MSNGWKNFINEILLNIDNGKPRNIAPVAREDKEKIHILNETDALILWENFIPESAKYALRFERTYGEPIERTVFDENAVGTDERKDILSSMHECDVPILIYWNNHIALKTDWKTFTEYWENFFYYPEDAIVFIDRDHIYFYNEMEFKILTELKSDGISGGSPFDFMQRFEDGKERKNEQIDCLFKNIPEHIRDDLYRLFYIMSEGFKVVGDEKVLKEYMEYSLANWGAKTEKLMLASKPYKKECPPSLNELKSDPETLEERFNAILRKITDRQS